MLPLVFLRDAIEIPYISRDMLLISLYCCYCHAFRAHIFCRPNMRQFVYNLAQRFKAHKTRLAF